MRGAVSELYPLDDVEALFVGAIKGHLADSTPVATRAPATSPPRYVRLSRVGGPASLPFLDGPMLTFECWATNDGAAEELCRRVRAFVRSLEGQKVGRAKLSGFTEVSGPAYFPDPDTPAYHRYQFTLQLRVRWARA